MSRYIDADKLKTDLYNSGYCNNNWLDIEMYINNQPTADVVEVGKWCDMREYILEMQADENGHNEFFRIIKLDDELKERIANEIENAILYGKRTDT